MGVLMLVLIAALLSRAGAGRFCPRAVWGVMLGALAPELDRTARLFSPELHLKVAHAALHSVFTAPLLVVACAGAIRGISRQRCGWGGKAAVDGPFPRRRAVEVIAAAVEEHIGRPIAANDVAVGRRAEQQLIGHEQHGIDGRRGSRGTDPVEARRKAQRVRLRELQPQAAQGDFAAARHDGPSGDGSAIDLDGAGRLDHVALRIACDRGMVRSHVGQQGHIGRGRRAGLTQDNWVAQAHAKTAHGVDPQQQS